MRKLALYGLLPLSLCLSSGFALAAADAAKAVSLNVVNNSGDELRLDTSSWEGAPAEALTVKSSPKAAAVVVDPSKVKWPLMVKYSSPDNASFCAYKIDMAAADKNAAASAVSSAPMLTIEVTDHKNYDCQMDVTTNTLTINSSMTSGATTTPATTAPAAAPAATDAPAATEAPAAPATTPAQ